MMATRTRALTENQRAVLDTLARGGRLVENTGMRGFMRSLTLYQPGAVTGEEVNRAVLRSLYNPFVDRTALYGPTENPDLVERYTPRTGKEFHHVYYRLTAKGRAALRLGQREA